MINKMFLRRFGLYLNLIESVLCQVIIMGATNRPEDIDPAILRRMPTKIHIKLPVCPFQNKSDCFLKTNKPTNKKHTERSSVPSALVCLRAVATSSHIHFYLSC